jgi:hypothetical protein
MNIFRSGYVGMLTDGINSCVIHCSPCVSAVALSDAGPSAVLELHQRAPALPEQGASALPEQGPSGRRGGPAINTKGMSVSHVRSVRCFG